MADKIKILIGAIVLLATAAVWEANQRTIFGVSLYCFLKDQGGIIAGLLALWAGLKAYEAGRLQVRELKEQTSLQKRVEGGRQKQTRVALSSALMEIHGHSKQIAEATLSILPEDRQKTIYDTSITTMPKLAAPSSAVQIVTDAVATAVTDSALAGLANICEMTQVQDWRYDDTRQAKQQMKRFRHISDSEVFDNLTYSFRLMSWCAQALLYARLLTDEIDTPSAPAICMEGRDIMEASGHERLDEIISAIEQMASMPPGEPLYRFRSR